MCATTPHGDVEHACDRISAYPRDTDAKWNDTSVAHAAGGALFGKAMAIRSRVYIDFFCLAAIFFAIEFGCSLATMFLRDPDQKGKGTGKSNAKGFLARLGPIWQTYKDHFWNGIACLRMLCGFLALIFIYASAIEVWIAGRALTQMNDPEAKINVEVGRQIGDSHWAILVMYTIFQVASLKYFALYQPLISWLRGIKFASEVPSFRAQKAGTGQENGDMRMENMEAGQAQHETNTP